MKKRNYDIDIMKLFFVLGMILSHVLDTLLINQNSFPILLRHYFNLISFSGFMFIFGYNAYNAYINEEETCKTKFIKNILNLLIAFWISGFLYDYFAMKNYYLKNYVHIFFLLRLPGYSEFLVTFALTNLFILIFKKYLKKVTQKNIYIFIGILISLLFSIIPPINNNIPWINLILKTNSSSFPLIPYINLFFFGIYFAKNKPNYKFIILIILAFCYLLYCFNIDKATRFPISIYYIIASYIYIYGYYYISQLSNYIKNKKVINYICLLGKNSLLSLVISNILILTLPYFNIRGNIYITILLYILIILICYIVSYICARYKKYCIKLM